MILTICAFPLISLYRLPCSIWKPNLRSRHLYAGCHSTSKQNICWAYPKSCTILWFWHHLVISTLERWFTCVRLLKSYLTSKWCLLLYRSRPLLLTEAAYSGLQSIFCKSIARGHGLTSKKEEPKKLPSSWEIIPLSHLSDRFTAHYAILPNN